MEPAFVSCIITCYNQGSFVREAIDSVFAQTYDRLQVIIVDDGSTDDTHSIIAKYAPDPRVITIHNTHSGLPACCRNAGLEAATGSYVAFLDGDDIWHPTKIEKQLYSFADDFIGIGTATILIGDTTLVRPRKMTRDVKLDFRQLAGGATVPLSSLMVRNIGHQFDESPDLKYVEDFDFQLNITSASGKPLRQLSEPLVYYRLHPESGSNSLERMRSVFQVLEKYAAMLDPKTISTCVAVHSFGLGLKAMKLGLPSRPFFNVAADHAHGGRRLLPRTMALADFLPHRFVQTLMRLYYRLTHFRRH